MKHRAFSLGGDCAVDPAAGGGTVVTVTVPLVPNAPEAVAVLAT